jgi:hypothetical protein
MKIQLMAMSIIHICCMTYAYATTDLNEIPFNKSRQLISHNHSMSMSDFYEFCKKELVSSKSVLDAARMWLKEYKDVEDKFNESQKQRCCILSRAIAVVENIEFDIEKLGGLSCGESGFIEVSKYIQSGIVIPPEESINKSEYAVLYIPTNPTDTFSKKLRLQQLSWLHDYSSYDLTEDEAKLYMAKEYEKFSDLFSKRKFSEFEYNRIVMRAEKERLLKELPKRIAVRIQIEQGIQTEKHNFNKHIKTHFCENKASMKNIEICFNNYYTYILRKDYYYCMIFIRDINQLWSELNSCTASWLINIFEPCIAALLDLKRKKCEHNDHISGVVSQKGVTHGQSSELTDDTLKKNGQLLEYSIAESDEELEGLHITGAAMHHPGMRASTHALVKNVSNDSDV